MGHWGTGLIENKLEHLFRWFRLRYFCCWFDRQRKTSYIKRRGMSITLKNMFNTGTFSCRKCWLTKTYSLSDCWFWRINRTWKVAWRRLKFHNSFSWPSWKNTRGIYSHVAPLLVKDSQKDWSGWHSKFTLGRVRGSQFHCLYVDFRWSISSSTSLRLFLLSFKGNRWNFDTIFLSKILIFNR